MPFHRLAKGRLCNIHISFRTLGNGLTPTSTTRFGGVAMLELMEFKGQHSPREPMGKEK